MATFVLAHGAWSAAWSWKKMRPLMAASGHVFLTPTYTGLGELSHLANPSIDLDAHIDDVVRHMYYEDAQDVVLLGHSYGGMVATGVADRAAPRIAQVIYLDAFVPRNGQSLADLLPKEQYEKMLAGAAQGDGWRVPSNPSPEDTSPEDAAWIAERRLPHPLKCFQQPLVLRHGETSLPRSFIYASRNTASRFGPFAKRAQTEPGWRYYEIASTHTPNVTAPDALMRLLNVILAETPS